MTMLRSAFLTVALLAMAPMLVGCGDETPTGAPPPPEVGVITLKVEPVTLSTELPGRTSPFAVSEVRPQVNGIITSRKFVEGAAVKAGDVLYEIDSGPYRAAYDSARAALTSASASVTSTKARAERFAMLLKANAISKQDHDDAQANYQQAAANTAQAKAQMDAARINLDNTKVTAPISGVIGRSAVTQGALVTAAQPMPLASIQQLDPIYVDITQSSVQLLRLKKLVANGQVDRDTPVATQVKLLLEDGSIYPHEGKLQFSEVTVEQNTGSVTLRALFPNAERLLLPGMFVRAVVSEGVDPKGLLIPQEALQYDEKGRPIAFVVDKDKKAQRRSIQVVRTMGNKWLVKDGLNDGEQLILEGLQKVQPNIVVNPVPAGAPTPAPATSAPGKPGTAE